MLNRLEAYEMWAMGYFLREGRWPTTAEREQFLREDPDDQTHE